MTAPCVLFDRMKELVSQWEPHRESMLKSIEETHGTHNEDDVLAQILGGQLKVWAFERSMGLTEFQTFPRFKALNLFLAAGSKDDLFSHEADFMAYGKANGCTRFKTGGRAGWVRCHPEGWDFDCAIMYKDIA